VKQTRVIIVEDEASVRQGLSSWLSQDYEVSAFETAEAFMAAIDDFQFEDGIPTCMLLDFQMPGMTGVELQSNIRLMNLEFPIVFMSGNAQHSDIIDAFHGGAVDFILKPFTGAQVSAVLEALFKKMALLQQTTPPIRIEAPLTDVPITAREAEALLLLGKGHRQHEVAEILGISLRTVKMHRAALKNKLNLNTLVELTRYYDQHRASIEKVAQS
jgi:FixJ family two-component response regulator